MPSVLYRFTSLAGDHRDRIKRLLVQSELYFAPRTAFNDPLDCRVTLSFSASELKLKQYWREAARRENPGVPMSQLKAHVRSMVQLHRTDSGRERLRNNLFKALDRDGILCLTEESANPLMWSYSPMATTELHYGSEWVEGNYSGYLGLGFPSRCAIQRKCLPSTIMSLIHSIARKC
jgi:hypothetical protein